jgi:phosphate transport system substrate-binding protein
LLSATPGAIAYGSCGAPASVKVLRIAAGKGSAVAPGPDTLAAGTYPLARPLLVHVPGYAQEHAKRYLDWLLSERGQRVVESLGYVRAGPR